MREMCLYITEYKEEGLKKESNNLIFQKVNSWCLELKKSKRRNISMLFRYRKTKFLNPLKIFERSWQWNENFGGWEEDQENVLFWGKQGYHKVWVYLFEVKWHITCHTIHLFKVHNLLVFRILRVVQSSPSI